ncbi:MAG: hypothetical protein IIW58_06525 [Bacteroidales bacterium]|nr:hypothetical protein [Bacteroidales bacterium]
MKRTLLLICTLLCANVLFAQEQLAVLRHNDSTSVFYGQSAFKQAYNAATHGDIITLSDGTFSVPDSLKKGITIRGNGACADTARRSTGTYFMERVKIASIADSLQLNVEGIYFDELYIQNNVYNLNITRCHIDYIVGIQSNNRFKGLNAVNCIINSGYMSGFSNASWLNYTNCILKEIPSFAVCNNCILIGQDYNTSNTGNSYYSRIAQYNNCIIRKTNGYANDTTLNQNVINSILIGFTSSDSPASSGNVVMSLSDVFENWDGESLPTDLETYVLKSSVSDSIQSLDGSEVGIFGGFMPFDWRPSYSIIKRFNVANRTTADGKLSVDIEVISE